MTAVVSSMEQLREHLLASLAFESGQDTAYWEWHLATLIESSLAQKYDIMWECPDTVVSSMYRIQHIHDHAEC